MNLNLPVFIHPGFPKTATSTLQNVFNRHSEMIYVEYSDELETAMFAIKGINYKQSKVDSLVKQSIYEQNDENKKCIIWSQERMVMEPYLLSEMAHRIYSIFPQAVIVFTIRNQNDLINSLYHGRALQLSGITPSHVIPVPKKYVENSVSFEEWLEYSYDNWYFSYLFQLDYNFIISLYEKVFGRDKVFIFLFEEFLIDKDLFFKKLSELMGISYEETVALYPGIINPSLTSNEVNLRKIRFNLFPPSSVREKIYKIIFHPYLRREIKKALRFGKMKKSSYEDITCNMPENIISSYREGNRKLNERYNLNLDEYGYII